MTIKINMGCGWRDFGNDWVHIDSGDYKHLDAFSITDLSQYENNTVDLIYASHVVEYFDRTQIGPLLEEWNRVLKPGGVLRLAVPNFENIAKLYHSGGYSLDYFVGLLYGKMPMGNETIYHKTVYDFESLSKVVESAGFKHPCEWDWRQTEHGHYDDHSQAYLPHMDKDKGTLMSLNLECIK
jgi:predicted SAM-dependent methyltransferase|tara:strand:- start:1322 stop:1867 length:546 start_codon:yes stop_codon:yes gene_type:complete